MEFQHVPPNSCKRKYNGMYRTSRKDERTRWKRHKIGKINY